MFLSFCILLASLTHQIAYIQSPYFKFLMSNNFRNQGAVLAGVLPESLLKYEDCQEWLDQKFKDTDFIECSDKLSFQKLSNKSWTKVLMQVIKVRLNCTIYKWILHIFIYRF